MLQRSENDRSACGQLLDGVAVLPSTKKVCGIGRWLGALEMDMFFGLMTDGYCVCSSVYHVIVSYSTVQILNLHEVTILAIHSYTITEAVGS